ncbi:MAG: lysostaphin resistance A-like protein [Planctomycetaceae bacterium]
MVNAQAAIVVVMFSISAAVWWHWSRCYQRFGEVCPREPLPSSGPSLVAVLLTVAYLWLSLVVVLNPPVRDPAQPISLSAIQAGCGERLLMVALLVPLAFGFTTRPPRDLGFTLTNWLRQVMDGLETAHASFIPVLCVLFVTSPLRSEREKNTLLRLLDQDRGLETLAWVLLAAVVLAPLVEELLFRVILLGWLKTKTTSAHAIGISSVAFALIHGPLDGVALLPLALLLGILYDRRQRYLSVVVAHAFFNLWNIVLTLAAR